MPRMAGPTLRIAIVDDEEPVRKALHRLLSAANLHSRTFATGAEFLAQRSTICSDCLLLDLHMPGLTGLDVLEQLSAASARMPTIIITAHNESGIRERCLAAGAAAYLCKPLDGQMLLDTISEVVARARTR